ncbi:hypothetical protein QUF72_03930 [Desulfobacterales bacterium HSG2]|nr:hypothetical protein [Desulfobacterales bacterium HSG2]
MKNSVVLEEIMFDDEELGLADELLAPDTPLTTVVRSDEKADIGAEVFFGVELPFDDIGEVKAKVLSCEKTDEKNFAVVIEILGLDNRYTRLLTKILKGKSHTDGDDKEYPMWATGLRQTNGTYATVINCPAGLLNTDQLAKITEITKNGAGVAKLTHAQRVILLLKPEQQNTIRDELKSVGLNIGVLHHGIRNIRGCCGALCEWNQGGEDAIKLSLDIDKTLFGRSAKYDVKIAVSGCIRNCMESYCVDIGLIGRDGKYDLFVGGVSSSVHFKALKLTGNVAANDAIPLIERVLEWYENTAREGERIYKTLERLGHSEAEKKKQPFAEAAAIFEGMDIGDDISSRLERTLARGYGLLKMRKDLGIK